MHLVEGQAKLEALAQLKEGEAPCVDRLPKLGEGRGPARILRAQHRAVGAVGQQHPGLLKAFPHRGHPEGEASGFKTQAPAGFRVRQATGVGFQVFRAIVEVHLAAGKHMETAEIHRGGAPHHEHF